MKREEEPNITYFHYFFRARKGEMKLKKRGEMRGMKEKEKEKRDEEEECEETIYKSSTSTNWVEHKWLWIDNTTEMARLARITTDIH